MDHFDFGPGDHGAGGPEREAERAEISPRSRRNPPKTDAEKAAREKRGAELKAEIDEIESRLAAGGFKDTREIARDQGSAPA